MSKYSCDKCGKDFKQKSHYTTHMNKKNPCVIESKIKELIDNAVKENLEEKKKKKQLKLQIIDNVVGDINCKMSIIKPLLKWVGGKTQILEKLLGDFPVEMKNYREVFLGGGSVLLALLCYVKSGVIKINGNIYAYDLNEPLIWVYKNIQMRPTEVFAEIQKIIQEFNSCGKGEINRKPKNVEEAKLEKENYYYWIRSQYNKLNADEKKTVVGSAMFVFMNKTCFRGVFRVGPNGFNVPYGHYGNPEIINKEHLDEVSDLIQGVIFECRDFSSSLSLVEENDFVYLDPPYAPETDTSFVGYTENGFGIDSHNNLFALIHGLTETNKKMMLSNADVTLVRENFSAVEKYNINSIMCKRAINSKKPDAKTKEVIIKNYA